MKVGPLRTAGSAYLSKQRRARQRFFSALSRRADASSDRPYAMSLTRVRISMHKNKKEREKEMPE